MKSFLMSFPCSTDSRMAVVKICVVLVNSLGGLSLPSNSVVRLSY